MFDHHPIYRHKPKIDNCKSTYLMCNKIHDLEINRFTTRAPDLNYPVIFTIKLMSKLGRKKNL